MWRRVVRPAVTDVAAVQLGQQLQTSPRIAIPSFPDHNTIDRDASIYRTVTRLHVSEDLNLQQLRCQNLKCPAKVKSLAIFPCGPTYSGDSLVFSKELCQWVLSLPSVRALKYAFSVVGLHTSLGIPNKISKTWSLPILTPWCRVLPE